MRTLLAAALLALAGCAQTIDASCRPGTPAAGETGVCFASAGWTLRGDVAGAAGPVVLLVHGADEDRRGWDALQRDLAAAGARALTFDLRGHGETTRGAARGEPWNFTADEWNAMAADVEAAAAFAEARWGARPAAAAGAGVGANLALRWAAALESPPRLALLSPGLDYEGVRAADDAARLAGPALLVVAGGDAYAAESVDRLLPTMREAEALRVGGRAHGTDLLEARATAERVVAWLT